MGCLESECRGAEFYAYPVTSRGAVACGLAAEHCPVPTGNRQFGVQDSRDANTPTLDASRCGAVRPIPVPRAVEKAAVP